MTVSSVSAVEDVRDARDRAAQHGIITVYLDGRPIELLPPEQLGYLAGLAALAFLGIVEWPVAAVVAVGHTLMYRSHRRGLRALGAALEEA